MAAGQANSASAFIIRRFPGDEVPRTTQRVTISADNADSKANPARTGQVSAPLPS